jgi:D-sedoheptulose 7-phosphate isomerase
MNTRSQQVLDQLMIRQPLLNVCRENIRNAFELMARSYRSGGKMLVCGNGGSAADADHIVGELMKGFLLKRKISQERRDALIKEYGRDGEYLADRLQSPLPAIALTGHPALTHAFMNDVAPDLVFAQQVLGYGNAGDVLVAISTSGNSANVVNAARTAKAFGLKVIGLTGEGGGAIAPLGDVMIMVPASETYLVQEYHLPVYHALCAMLEYEFFYE